MKIAKFTWLHNGNYGSVLQAFALQKYIEKNGYEVVDINYKPSIVSKMMNYLININSLNIFFVKYKEKNNKKSIKEQYNLELREKRFESFIYENMKLTDICKSPKELKKISKDYDIFICGSDQIWSPKLMNPLFYFSFVPDEKIKISYAPSFGVTDTNYIKRKKIKKLLNRFNHISIRENQGQQLIKELINKDVMVPVDPTMLLNEQEWNEYIDSEAVFKEKYVFCYLLSTNEEYLKNIKEFAAKNKLKVVIVPTINGPFNTGFEEYFEAGPREWLNLVKNASYVFTDSFHGCIFSVLFHKEVFLYKRFSDQSKKSENSRVYTLVNWLGIPDRLIDENTMNNIFDMKKIDYERVDKNVENRRKVSSDWLMKILRESEQ